MIRSKTDTEVRYRSLLQKAVRRGHADIVYTVSALLESLNSKKKDWYRTRTAIIAFEECWPSGSELNFNRKFHSKVAALIKVTRALKIKDASGLGHLAYALSRGDSSVYDGTPDDQHIKIVANAVQRPDDFWKWISTRKQSARQAALLENARRFRNEGWPHDRAVLLAAAYLAVTVDSPAQIEFRPPPRDETFPFWIVFDRYSPEGKLALRDVARSMHIPLPQLEWTCFYFEGSRTNGEANSGWWQRRCNWHFQKIGMQAEEAHLVWEPARQQVIDALSRDGSRLKSDLYRWKLSNLKKIESLKRQVDLYLAHFEDVRGGQTNLF